MIFRKKTLLVACAVICILFAQTGCAHNLEDLDSTDVHAGVPSFYLEQLTEKEKAINKAISDSDSDGYSFIFFSDAHWGKNFKHSPALISDIINNTSIKDVYFGGDIITTRSDDKNAMMKLGYEFQSAFSFLGNHFYCIYGNHDNNSDGQRTIIERHLSEDEVKGFLNSQMTGSNTAIDGYNFYVDIEESKTRVIGLDTGRYYYSTFRDTLPFTVAFLVKALYLTPDDWHIVIVSHLWCNLKKEGDQKVCYIEPFIKNVLNVLDDYNNRESGLYLYGKGVVSYDFSEAGSKVHLCIGGHNHRDATLYSGGGIPVVVVDSDRIRNNDDKNTVYEQSVSAVVIDYSNNKASFFRIGRGDDMVIKLQ